MPINDAVNNVYMSNMHVTGGNANTNYVPSSGALMGTQGMYGNNLGTANKTAGSQNGLNNSFSQMLSGMMTMNTAGLSTTGIGDFSNLGGSGGSYSSGLSGLMGMGGGTDILGGGSDNSMMMMMLMLVLAQQQGNNNNSNQNNSMLNNMYGANQNAYGAYGTQMAACAHNAYSAAAGQGIPTNSWVASNPSITSNIGQRSADIYRAVINQFNVETNQRYAVNKQGQGDTYCNIFLWDVTRAMGAEIPHFTDAAGRPVSSGAGGAKELDANQINTWLNTNGQTYGWTRVSAEEAQYYANMGMPAVTSWKNPSGHGHVQVVSPSVDGRYDPTRGVAISQAGSKLKNYDYITSIYGAGTLPQVEYFVHI